MDPTSSSKTTINLPGGPITALADDSLIRARGIKYATATRFQKPQPLSSWTETQDCTKPASICPQNPSRLGFVNGNLEAGRTQDEDCLHVTVVAPRLAKNAPVMVFLHGGAWVSGGGDLDAYSPHQLASRGVVAVSVTHRLGVFGYVPIEGVAPANLGLLDQVEALRWIQRNIASFGGDPGNVTLFGQSAGGDAIFCLAIAEGAEGLFHRGILQSPPASMREDENRTAMTRGMSEHAAKTVSPGNAVDVPVSALLKMTVELLILARKISPALLSYGPIMGEYPLPPAEEALGRFLSAAERISMFFGWTANEDTAFTQIDTRPEAKAYLGQLFKGSTEELARRVGEHVGRQPPTYEVAWHPESSELKATHCIDLPLILGGWSAWKGAPMLQGPETEGILSTVGDAVKDLWVAFAKGEDVGEGRFVIDQAFRFP